MQSHRIVRSDAFRPRWERRYAGVVTRFRRPKKTMKAIAIAAAVWGANEVRGCMMIQPAIPAVQHALQAVAR